MITNKLPINTAFASQAAQGQDPKTAQEAAKEFEKILVRQLVETMTKDLFKESIAGEGGPNWMEGQRDTQRGVMTDVLTEHLVDSGAFKIGDLLTRQWAREHLMKEGATQEPSDSSFSSPTSQKTGNVE